MANKPKLWCKKHERVLQKYERCIDCRREYNREYKKAYNQRPYVKERRKEQHLRWQQRNRERLNMQALKRRRPERFALAQALGITGLYHNLNNGDCRWEACLSTDKKIYAQGLCRTCYARIKNTHNAPQAKDLYQTDYLLAQHDKH